MSILKSLRGKKRITKDVETLVSALTIEELVQLKLEITAINLEGQPYGFKIWQKLPSMVKHGVYQFAKHHFKTQTAAARFLGVSLETWKNLRKDPNYNEER